MALHPAIARYARYMGEFAADCFADGYISPAVRDRHVQNYTAAIEQLNPSHVIAEIRNNSLWVRGVATSYENAVAQITELGIKSRPGVDIRIVPVEELPG